MHSRFATLITFSDACGVPLFRVAIPFVRAPGYGLEGAQMKGYWDHYLRKKSDGLRPLASPVRQGLHFTAFLFSRGDRRVVPTDQRVWHVSCFHSLMTNDKHARST